MEEGGNGKDGPKMTMIERIAKALEPKGNTNPNFKRIRTQHTLSKYPMHTLTLSDYRTLIDTPTQSIFLTHPLSHYALHYH